MKRPHGSPKTDHKKNADFKILIVEDEAISALMLKNFLLEAGYTVLDIAQSGEMVLELLKKTTPDLILMDVIIRGEFDGITTMEKIREKNNIPVIYSTGNTDIDTMTRAMATNPLAVIVKPINRQELLGIIKDFHCGFSKK